MVRLVGAGLRSGTGFRLVVERSAGIDGKMMTMQGTLFYSLVTNRFSQWLLP